MAKEALLRFSTYVRDRNPLASYVPLSGNRRRRRAIIIAVVVPLNEKSQGLKRSW